MSKGSMEDSTVHIVGQSHIDVAWRWRYDPETICDCCQLTFIRAIDNLRMHPEYTFSQSQVPLYQATKEHFPLLFTEMKKYIKEGRWEIVGGTYVEAEGGEPCGESLVRQYLYGKRYFQKEFGVDVKVGWMPDTWTHPWQLPQILKKSGIDYYVFHRCEKGHSLFWWEAPDGSRVLAYSPSNGTFTRRPFPDLEEYAFQMSIRYGVKDTMFTIGAGDHGGGPMSHEIDNIKAYAREHHCRVQFGTPQRVFEKISGQAKNLPVLRDELGFELVGDLTNLIEIKKANRRGENLLMTTEKFLSMAMVFADLLYPQDEIYEAWEKLLFNQFHDIIGGSVIPSAAEDAHMFYQRAFQLGEAALKNSLKAISSKVNTEGEGTGIIVFNPLSWERTNLVEVEMELAKPAETVKLTDSQGNQIPIQVTERMEKEGKLYLNFFFEAEGVPSMGYKTYRAVPSRGEISYPNPLKATEREMENGFFRVRFSPTTGCLESLYDKENKREVVDVSGRGNLPQAIEDVGDSEGRLQLHTPIVREDDIFAKFTGPVWDVDSNPKIELVEKGPVRAKVRVRKEYQHSTFTQEISLYSKIRRVDFDLTLDWHDIHRAVKVAFPINIPKPIVTYEVQYGSIVRPSTGEEQPSQQWVDLSEPEGGYGVSLLNDSIYAHDVRRNVIRMTVLRSPTIIAYNTDEGIHSYRYALYPHFGGWKASGVAQRGYELNNPLIPVVEPPHKGELPPAFSFINIEPENLILTAVKKAEDGKELILRLYEVWGKKCVARISLKKTIQSAYKEDLLEKDLQGLKFSENLLETTVDPYEIVTLKVGVR